MNPPLDKNEFRVFIAIAMMISLIIMALLIDELVDGVGERQCIENIGSVSKDGYERCDL